MGKSVDIMGDLIPLMIDAGMRVKAFIYMMPWLDVGSLERYTKLDARLFGRRLLYALMQPGASADPTQV